MFRRSAEFLKRIGAARKNRRHSAPRLARAVQPIEYLEPRLLLSIAPSFTNADTTTVNVGSALDFEISTSGTPTVHLSENGGLPPGIQFINNHDGTAVLTGVATGAGSNGVFNVTFKATNNFGGATQIFTLDVDQTATFTNHNNAVLNNVFGGSRYISVSNGFPTPVLSIGSGPPGLTLIDNHNGTGELVIAPNAAVPANYYAPVNGDPVILDATNAAGVATQTFMLTIDGIPTLSFSPSFGTVPIGSPVNFNITTTGFPLVSLQFRGSLPNGVGFQTTNNSNDNGTGTISGVPTQAGVFNFQLVGVNQTAIGKQVILNETLTVSESPSFTSNPLTIFTVGKSNSFTVKTKGYPPPTLSFLGSLPAGVSFQDNGNGTATISGVPQAATGGDYSLTLEANGGEAIQPFSLIVQQAPVFTTPAAASFTAAVAGTFNIVTTGFPFPVFSLSGKLPTGLSLTDFGDGSATISGTPSATSGGSYSITLTAKNSAASVQQKLTLTVAQAPGLAGSPPSFTATENQSVNHTIALSGFPTPISISDITNLPAGLTLAANSTGTALLLTGKPTVTGSFTVSFLLSNVDFNGVDATSANFSITINP